MDTTAPEKSTKWTEVYLVYLVGRELGLKLKLRKFTLGLPVALSG